MVIPGTDAAVLEAKNVSWLYWMMREGYWGDGSHTHFHGTTRCLICGMQMELPSSFVLNGVTCTDCRLRQKRVVEEWESENELTDPNQ